MVLWFRQSGYKTLLGFCPKKQFSNTDDILKHLILIVVVVLLLFLWTSFALDRLTILCLQWNIFLIMSYRVLFSYFLLYLGTVVVCIPVQHLTRSEMGKAMQLGLMSNVSILYFYYSVRVLSWSVLVTLKILTQTNFLNTKTTSFTTSNGLFQPLLYQT